MIVLQWNADHAYYPTWAAWWAWLGILAVWAIIEIGVAIYQTGKEHGKQDRYR